MNNNDRGRKRYPRRSRDSQRSDSDSKIDRMIEKIKREIYTTIDPICLKNLNAFERKIIHRHFDNNPNVSTRTYRDGEEFELRIYPVGNLKKFAQEKAQQAIESGEKVVLPPMSSYERFIIHDALKDHNDIKSASFGEGHERHIEIEPDIFGRGLKKIIKKIRLF